jgi:hypothetical protein
VCSLVPFFLVSFFGLPESRAQRVYQRGPDLMLEDAQGRLSSLGTGFNAVPISDHKFLLIRGKEMGYGEESDCGRPAVRNRVVLYDTRTKKESLLFDKPLSDRIMGRHDAICVYEYADLSPPGPTLYIVSPFYVTSGCLAIIDLPAGEVRYVSGAMDVFVIRGGSNAGDLFTCADWTGNPPTTTRAWTITSTSTLGLTDRKSRLFQTKLWLWSGETHRLRFYEPTCDASTVASLCKANGFLKSNRIQHLEDRRFLWTTTKAKPRPTHLSGTTRRG